MDFVGHTCPFCQAVIKPADRVEVCSECRTAHHEECWRESGGCTTPGCRGVPAASADAPRQQSRTGVNINTRVLVNSGGGGSRIVINGREYRGNSIVIQRNGQVLIDGIQQNQERAGAIRVEVEGNLARLEAHGDVSIRGDVNEVKADGSVECGNVNGDVHAGASVVCGDVGGDVDSGGTVTCADVGGDVDCGGSVNCKDIGGNIDAGGSVTHA